MFQDKSGITHIETDQPVEGISLKTNSPIRIIKLLAYIRVVFIWALGHEYYELIMSVITRLEV